MPKLLEYELGNEVHAFSTMRAAGQSQDAYAHFNINPYCGDNPEHVAQNVNALCHMLDIATQQLGVATSNPRNHSTTGGQRVALHATNGAPNGARGG